MSQRQGICMRPVSVVSYDRIEPLNDGHKVGYLSRTTPTRQDGSASGKSKAWLCGVPDQINAHPARGHIAFPQRPRISTMASTSREQNGRDGALSTFDADIQALNHAKDTCGLPPAQGAFDSSSALLTTIKVRSHSPARRFKLTFM